MAIKVEFFGVPRQRTGVAQVLLNDLKDPISLRVVLETLGRKFPDFAATCLNNKELLPAFLVNVGGRQFVSDPETRLIDGESLLVMSADAGG